MSIVPKISRLRKLPGLLKHKQEAEERSKKDRDQPEEKERPPFEVEDEVTIDPDTLSVYKVDILPHEPRHAKSDNKNVGKNVDVTV